MARSLAVPVPHSQPEAVARLDEAAFTELYRTTARRLWAYVYRVTGDGADTDDIVQEAFCRLLCKGPEQPDQEQWRRYLYRVASNLVVDRWRQSARQDASPPASRQTAPEAASDDESAIARTFAQLSTRDRTLLWLAYVEEESHEEIAASLNLRRHSIKVLLFRARRRLRELLSAERPGGSS